MQIMQRNQRLKHGENERFTWGPKLNNKTKFARLIVIKKRSNFNFIIT
jgi:hypothetical protein